MNTAEKNNLTTNGISVAPKKARRGFGAMPMVTQKDIASKGGSTISRDREHMSRIGRKGGKHSHAHDAQPQPPPAPTVAPAPPSGPPIIEADAPDLDSLENLLEVALKLLKKRKK